MAELGVQTETEACSVLPSVSFSNAMKEVSFVSECQGVSECQSVRVSGCSDGEYFCSGYSILSPSGASSF